MPQSAWFLPPDADPESVRFANGVIFFDTADKQAPFKVTGAYGDQTDADHVLVVDPVNRYVTLDGQDCHVTAQGFRVLLEFVKRPEAYIDTKQLYEAVWGGSYAEVKTRAVTFAVYRLRQVLPAGWLRYRPSYGWRLLPPG